MTLRWIAGENEKRDGLKHTKINLLGYCTLFSIDACDNGCSISNVLFDAENCKQLLPLFLSIGKGRFIKTFNNILENSILPPRRLWSSYSVLGVILGRAQQSRQLYESGP